ncbi:MAG: D-alanyl-D-alanine carboxypeptidase family protein [Patescibacteria group bacterium]
MNSSWKRRVSSLLVPAALVFAALFPNLPAAAAAGCPTTAVDEEGGKHWCYNHDSAKGHVHLWTPAGFNAEGAVTAVYVHGHDLAGDACPSEHYVDCAWDAHKLASQFKASGVNALFVAVEGSTSSDDSRKWGSLSSLLASIADKGNIAPSPDVTVLGHSAGMYTAKSLWADARVRHLVALDWLKPDLDKNVASWYRGGQDRRLTIVSGSSGQTAIGIELAASLGCPTVTGTSGLNADQIAARCLHIKGVAGGHMGVVTGQAAIPLALRRSDSGAATGTGAASTTGGGATTSVGTQPLEDAVIGGPALEIPIPNVEFSDAIRQNGQITIPWLAQYIGGVYIFLLSIAGLTAAVMMVVGGFQYVTSGGDKGRIGAGKKRIVNALTGLVLALGSYTILYAINPELVAFDGLKVGGVQTSLFMDTQNGSNEGGLISATESTSSASSAALPGGRPSALCNSESSCKSYCDEYYRDPTNIPQVAPGMASTDQVAMIPTDIPGVNGFGNSASPTTIALLRKVGPLFAADGYKLAVTSAYRDLRGQFKLACGAYKEGHGTKVGRTIANPGGSFHGVGYAIDVQLWRAGKQVTISGNSSAQQKEDPQEAKYLAETMLKAGFRRLNNEIWHFEPSAAPAADCRCYRIEDCTLPPNVRCPN